MGLEAAERHEALARVREVLIECKAFDEDFSELVKEATKDHFYLKTLKVWLEREEILEAVKEHEEGITQYEFSEYVEMRSILTKCGIALCVPMSYSKYVKKQPVSYNRTKLIKNEIDEEYKQLASMVELSSKKDMDALDRVFGRSMEAHKNYLILTTMVEQSKKVHNATL